ncbi:unnamed protein product [Sphagnum tenellum]
MMVLAIIAATSFAQTTVVGSTTTTIPVTSVAGSTTTTATTAAGTTTTLAGTTTTTVAPAGTSSTTPPQSVTTTTTGAMTTSTTAAPTTASPAEMSELDYIQTWCPSNPNGQVKIMSVNVTGNYTDEAGLNATADLVVYLDEFSGLNWYKSPAVSSQALPQGINTGDYSFNITYLEQDAQPVNSTISCASLYLDYLR